jgi:hypothetical protein
MSDALLIAQLNLDLPGELRDFVVESLRFDFEIDLVASFLDRVSELFNLTEDRAKNPEFAAFSRVDGRFTPPAR